METTRICVEIASRFDNNPLIHQLHEISPELKNDQLLNLRL